MADAVQNLFEIERRAIMWTPLITLNDGVTALGWDADPNTVVDGNTPGESWLYSLPVGQFYKQSNANLWWKAGSPNIWIQLQGGTAIDHNLLNNLQGGNGFDEYFHLIEEKYDLVNRLDEDSAGLTFDGESLFSAGSSGSSGTSGSSGSSGTSGSSGSSGTSGSSGAATINNNVDNYVLTATGTPGLIQGEANLTFDDTDLKLTNDKNIAFGDTPSFRIVYNSAQGSLDFIQV